MLRFKAILAVIAVVAWHAPGGAIAKTILASAVGVHLDTDLLKGGGTDATSALQQILDIAADGTPVHLIIDGPALVKGLSVYGNTTIECPKGGGLYLADNSSRAIIRNAHRSRQAITDQHIEVRGCFLNGNRDHQPSAALKRPDITYNGPSNREPDGTFLSGLQFLGVNYLTIEGVILWNVRAFGALIGNASYVNISNVVVDHGGGADAPAMEYLMTDGLHFKGPLHYVSIDTVKLRTGDDGLAFNANDFETDDITTRNDFGPYVGQGPITDVTVNNIVLMGQVFGIRILSTNERIDRILISNVIGTVGAYLLDIGHWVNPSSFGNVGAVTIDNVMVDRVATAPPEWEFPLFSLNARIELLQMRHISTKVVDRLSIFKMGSESAVAAMNVDLTMYDPSLAANVFELDKGGHIDQLNLALQWHGTVLDQGKDPIVSHGGEILRLLWLDTPPLYIDARAVSGDPSSIEVTFTQKISGQAHGTGVHITVNDHAAEVVKVTLQADGRAVRYKLASPIRAHDRVTWAYDARARDLQSIDGMPLGPVLMKRVRIGQP